MSNPKTYPNDGLIQSLDLSRIAPRLIEKEKFDPMRAQIAVQWYRNFLGMILKNSKEILVPNEDVDTAWHHHILDTERYVRDCNLLFGQYLHHNPYFYGTPAYDAACQKTEKLFEQEYGQAGFLTPEDYKKNVEMIK